MTVDDFAGGDQRYLQAVQYADSAKLDARSHLHAAYRTAAVPWRPWLAARVPWPLRGAVLDVGCGGGDLWAETTVLVPDELHLHLTDLSAGMVAAAVGRAIALDHFAAVTGGVVDVQDLPFADGRFDVVVANHMLYHVPDIGRGVAELARVLRPDGVAVVATNGARHMAQLDELQRQVFPSGDSVDATTSRFGRENGAAILGEHFGNVDWLTYDDALHCTSAADVLAYACSHPPAESATASQRAALAAAIDTALERGAGQIRIDKDSGVFLARHVRT